MCKAELMAQVIRRSGLSHSLCIKLSLNQRRERSARPEAQLRKVLLLTTALRSAVVLMEGNPVLRLQSRNIASNAVGGFR